jgi:hypothetical protein
VTAALLDPRCYNLVLVNKYLENLGDTKADFLARQVKYNILDCHLPEKYRAQEASSTSIDSNPKKGTTAEEVLQLSRKHSKTQEETRAAAVDREVKLYLASSDATDVPDNDILSYWRARRHQFPWLCTAVRKFLCIPATSTTAERVFSIAGLTVTAKRSRLSPERVDIIIFIHENYNVCKSALKM